MPLPEDRFVHSREYFDGPYHDGAGRPRCGRGLFWTGHDGRVQRFAAGHADGAGDGDAIWHVGYVGLADVWRCSNSPFLGQEWGYGRGGRDYSEDAARSIDEEVKRILNQSYDKALTIIRDNEGKMVGLAQMLMDVETLDRTEFEKLMNEPANGQLPGSVTIEGQEVSLKPPVSEQVVEPAVEQPAIDQDLP